MNKRQWLSVWGFALGAATAPYATAQTRAEAPAGPMVQQSGAGVDYLSGGAGEEDRTTMASRQADFPFKVVLSTTGGEYLVAEKLAVLTPQGSILTVRDAGPIVMMKLPPGEYVLEATYQCKTQRRPVHVAAGAQTVNWRFTG